jgi:hypothetical protein
MAGLRQVKIRSYFPRNKIRLLKMKFISIRLNSLLQSKFNFVPIKVIGKL